MENTKKAIVKKSTGSWYELLDEEGQLWQARLRGKFKQQGKKVTNPLSVGDQVGFEVENAEEGVAVIAQIEPRKNYLVRRAVKKSQHAHLIAANIDQALLMATLSHPKTSLGFIDRFLVSCEAFRIPAVVFFNKADLWDETQREEAEYFNYQYERIGYRVYLGSLSEQKGLEQVKELLKDKLTVVSGHSGVGKSTLLNLLNPGLDLSTAEISKAVKKGKHTTTFAEMHEVMPKSFVVDTPGIKEMGLAEIEPEELGHYFPEIRERMQECKFHNCSHTHEPGCAIIQALEAGEIWSSRYESYLSMLEGQESHR